MQDKKSLTPTTGSAKHELHTFVGKPNPDAEMTAAYKAAVAEWNTTHPDACGNERMKPCVLTLEFVINGTKTPVTVLQSARYVVSNDMSWVVEQMHDDAAFFRERGFDILREKIEADAFGNDAIPASDASVADRDGYFEAHVKVELGCADDIPELSRYAADLGARFDRPVPISWNANPDKYAPGDGEGGQRFVNVRFHDRGSKFFGKMLGELRAEINSKDGMHWLKHIAEWVWYDTNRAMDNGWIEFEN